MIKTDIIIDDSTETLNVIRTQEEQPIIDTLKDMRDAGCIGSSDMRFAGHLPFLVVEQYLQEKGITMREFILDDTHLVRIMNDPNYKLLRLWGGRL